mgnify:CR=1 FL=1
MDIRLNTKEEVLEFIREDQDPLVAAFVDVNLMIGAATLTCNQEDNVWNLRVDYHTVLTVSQTDGVMINDETLDKIFG